MKPDGSSRSEDWLLVRNNLKKDYLLAEITESELGIDDWQTDYWSLSPKQEFTLLMQALQRSGILSQVALPHKEILHNYFNAVKVEYTDAQYHNFHHAMSTVHYAYKLTMAGGLSHLITKTGCFASGSANGRSPSPLNREQQPALATFASSGGGRKKTSEVQRGGTHFGWIWPRTAWIWTRIGDTSAFCSNFPEFVVPSGSGRVLGRPYFGLRDDLSDILVYVMRIPH